MNKVEILSHGEANFQGEFKFKWKRTSCEACEGGKIIKRGKRGGKCMRKETFHEKVYSRQDGNFKKKKWKVV
jgi:Zn-finger domain-containing protein